jgi:uncharacterized protein
MNRPRSIRWLESPLTALMLLLCLGGSLFAQAQNLPPKPDRYVTDQAGVLDAATVSTLNNQLEQVEKETSNQIVVAIYPSLPPDAEIAQYGTMTAASWAAGQKGKDNGVVLFVFVNDHKMYIAVGRGLEGRLPDAICKNIVTQVITPQFKQGNYAGGIQAGVNAMIAATKGEYQGTGSTVDDQKGTDQGFPWQIIIFIIVIFILTRYGSSSGWLGPVIYTSSGWGGGGYRGGFGGGGGFSGGGGGFAGGGAGGSW